MSTQGFSRLNMHCNQIILRRHEKGNRLLPAEQAAERTTLFGVLCQFSIISPSHISLRLLGKDLIFPTGNAFAIDTGLPGTAAIDRKFRTWTPKIPVVSHQSGKYA